MQVVLKPELEKFVQEGVALKRYKSADAMVEEALRLLQAQEREDAEKLEALRRDVQVGLDQLDRGEYIEGKNLTVELIRDRAIKRLGAPVKRNAG